MRSRSTLLAHILGSHPEVSGYTESHIKYRNPWDTLRLRWHVGIATRQWPRGRWLLDKQLHNRMYLPSTLRRSNRVRVIVLIRNPLDTLRSMVSMGRLLGNDRDADPRLAAAYYCQRVATLAGLAVEFGDRALLVDSDSLVNDSDTALSRIAKHLSLTQPLSKSYQVRKLTGRSGFGDMSALIHSGQVSQQRDADTHDADHLDVVLPPQLASVLQRCFDNCVGDASAWVPTVGFTRA